MLSTFSESFFCASTACTTRLSIWLRPPRNSLMPTIIFILWNFLQFLTTRFVTTLNINGSEISRTYSVVRCLPHQICPHQDCRRIWSLWAHFEQVFYPERQREVEDIVSQCSMASVTQPISLLPWVHRDIETHWSSFPPKQRFSPVSLVYFWNTEMNYTKSSNVQVSLSYKIHA